MMVPCRCSPLSAEISPSSRNVRHRHLQTHPHRPAHDSHRPPTECEYHFHIPVRSPDCQPIPWFSSSRQHSHHHYHYCNRCRSSRGTTETAAQESVSDFLSALPRSAATDLEFLGVESHALLCLHTHTHTHTERHSSFSLRRPHRSHSITVSVYLKLVLRNNKFKLCFCSNY